MWWIMFECVQLEQVKSLERHDEVILCHLFHVWSYSSQTAAHLQAITSYQNEFKMNFVLKSIISMEFFSLKEISQNLDLKGKLIFAKWNVKVAP